MCEGIPLKALTGDRKLVVAYQEHLNLFILFISACLCDVKQINLWAEFEALRRLGLCLLNAKIMENTLQDF